MNLDLLFTRLKKLFFVLRSPYLLYVLLRFRVLASAEHANFLETKKFNTIVDVGANKGQFSLLANYFFPQSMIFAFEPLHEPFEIYKKIFDGNAKIKVYNVALSDSYEERVMHISGSDDSSSLLPISKIQTDLYPSTQEISKINLRAYPLKDFLLPDSIKGPSLLKIDVQGFELKVLIGGEYLIDLFDYIFCELSFVRLYEGQELAAEVIEWLSSRGFSLSGVFNVAYDKVLGPLQADFLFSNGKKNENINS
jgi:FkbM family methyltransferase